MRVCLFSGLPLLLVFTLGACGGAAIPQEQLTAAKAAVSGAEVGGAGSEPRAQMHLQRAKEGIAKAEQLIADDDNEEAASIIERATADADLALALARENGAKGEAVETKEQLERLKKSTE
jgi:hypothetical protein